MSTADRQINELPVLPTREPSPHGGFFARRWRGWASVGTVFWRDMLIIGTGINLVTSFVSLMALGFKTPTWVAMAIFFSPLPYNVFLVIALWRCLEIQPTRYAGTARIAALMWLAIVTVI